MDVGHGDAVDESHLFGGCAATWFAVLHILGVAWSFVGGTYGRNLVMWDWGSFGF